MEGILACALFRTTRLDSCHYSAKRASHGHERAMKESIKSENETGISKTELMGMTKERLFGR